mgnify:CR=1 FL=1
MADLLFEDELNMLLEQCKTMVNTDSYVVDQYTKERDNEFELAEKSGVDLGPYSNDEYNGFQLHEIRLGLEHRVNVKLYDDIAFSWEQMREIRKGLEHGLNASAYADSFYSDSQMHEIRMGLEWGIDVSSYAKLVYSKSDMSRMRSELFEAKYMEYSKGFARKYTDDETGAVIRFGDDLMEAFLTVPKDTSFTEAMIYNILEDNGVTYGYIAENITALAEKGSEAGEMQVAQGVRFEKGSDGSGYPDGLVGDDIPLAAQIVSLADVFDSLVSKRVYKNAYDTQKAFSMIMNGECGAFAPNLLTCLSKCRKQLEDMYVTL